MAEGKAKKITQIELFEMQAKSAREKELEHKVLLAQERSHLENKYGSLIEERLDLSRLVSFQGNKSVPLLRLYRYKEAFSFELVKKFLQEFSASSKSYVFDPFCGMGTTLLASMSQKIPSLGIDLLPVAVFIAKTIPAFLQLPEDENLEKLIKAILSKARKTKPAEIAEEVKIIKLAFDPETLLELRKIKSAIDELPSPRKEISTLLFFSILEDVSYTSKDGQFLRLKADKKMKQKPANLEAEYLQYQLRGSFFLRKLSKFLKLIKEISKISQANLQWNNLDQIGISKSAWEIIKSNKIKPHLIFGHPQIILSKPALIAYYRLLAVFSQKGVQRLAFGIQGLEEKTQNKLTEKYASKLANLFNQQISSLLEQNPQLSLDDLHFLAAMNFGTQVNGSWRNEIGKEGSRKVKELLLGFFSQQKVIKKIELSSGEVIAPKNFPGRAIEEIRKIKLKNKYQFIFGSEPDVSILNPSENLEGAMEIKAGLDPAGALERYGVAKKSFDKALAQNKSAITIYLASCITDEVRKHMESDRLVRKEFALTQILTDAKSRKDFFDYLKWLVRS